MYHADLTKSCSAGCKSRSANRDMQDNIIIIAPSIYILVEDALGIHRTGYICNTSYSSNAWSATTSASATTSTSMRAGITDFCAGAATRG